MKKILTAFVLISLFIQVEALGQDAKQNSVKRDSVKRDSVKRDSLNKDSLNKAVTTAHKLNTGNLQDILNNYIQVAAKGVTSSKTSVQLKLNWFALNPQDSVTKYDNKHFIKSWWQRNGEFVFAGGIDKNSKFNSFQAGFNYNLINRRDTAMHYYTAAYEKYFDRESVIIHNAIVKYSDTIIRQIDPKLTKTIIDDFNKNIIVTNLVQQISSQIEGFPTSSKMDSLAIKYLQNLLNDDIKNPRALKGSLSDKLKHGIKLVDTAAARSILNKSLRTYIKTGGKQPLSFNYFISKSLTTEMSKFIDDQVAADTTFKILKVKTLSDLNKKVLRNYEDLIKYIAQQPLLTIGYNYTYGTGTVLSSHDVSFQYLQGLSPLASPKATQLTASLSDTLTGSDPTGKTRNFQRNIIAFQAGFNKVLSMQKKVSVMELNLGVEDDRATNGYVTKTDKNKFTFNAYYRVRLPATPWLKLSIKYDPKAANILGLLDFTYNLDSAK
ncbi:MAG TPA: hypothetical protein VGN20_22270 [Mucilaginibacter sp.]